MRDLWSKIATVLVGIGLIGVAVVIIYWLVWLATE